MMHICDSDSPPIAVCCKKDRIAQQIKSITIMYVYNFKKLGWFGLFPEFSFILK